MKIHGRMVVQLHRFLTSAVVWIVIGQFHVPIGISPGENAPPLSIEYEAEWDPAPFWALWRTDKFFASVGNESLFVGCSALNLVTISTELS
jgi:hypothetical protein